MSQKAVKILKRKLTNLSSANPQLWIKRLKADFHLDCKDLDLSGGKVSWDIVEQVFSGKGKVILNPKSDPLDNTVNQINQKLVNISRKKKLIYEERGVDEMHLAYPFVQGQWPDGSWIRTPFLLIPCGLGQDSSHWFIQPELESAIINPAFLLAYAFHFKRNLDENLFEKEIGLKSVDATEYLTQLYHLLKESGIDILFNQDLFLKEIEPFQTIKKDELPEGFKPGLLKLLPNCVFGIFPQSDSVLIPDFEYLEKNEVSLEDIFLKDSDLKGNILEKSILAPLPMDGSQELAIRQIKAGQSLVIQGPPGTGKSQLISNVIADAIGSGKSVLLVCQKRVALEVVKNRLKEVGLENYIGLWSDFKKDRENLYGQMAKTIDSISEMEVANQVLDTVIMERGFIQTCNQIEQISQKLEEWKISMFDSTEAGISIYELYNSKYFENSPKQKSKSYSNFKYEEWVQFLEWFSGFWQDIFEISGPNSTFKERKNWFLLGEKGFNALPQKWEKSLSRLKKIFDKYRRICKTDEGERPFSVLQKRRVLINSILGSDNLISRHCPYLMANFKSFLKDPESLNQVKHKWKRLHSVIQHQEYWPKDLIIKKTEIPSILKDIAAFESYFRIWPAKKLISFFSKRASNLAFLESKFPKSPFQLRELKKSLENATLIFSLSKDIFLEDEIIMDEKRFLEIHKSHEHFINELVEIEIYKSAFTNISNLLDEKKLHRYVDYIEVIQDLNTLIIDLEKEIESWNSDFKSEQTRLLLSSFINPAAFMNDFDLIRNKLWRVDEQFSNIPTGWKELALEVTAWSFETKDWESLKSELWAGWARFWIEKMESKNTILGAVGSESWEADLRILKSSIAEKERLVGEILRLRLSENVYKHLEYNRLGNRTTYRDLYYQLTKKRMRPPLRKLWKEYESEIKRLVPVWLATPESVSATWPIEIKFDIVIFDESSQCFAERALPSAFRGNQLVVVGDEHQLTPNQLFSSRWDEDAEEDAVFSDQNSLLELSQQFLPQTMLTHHYRSQFPELIHFSNLNFYQSRLEFYGHPSNLKPRKFNLHWNQISGSWINQQNEMEAKEIAGAVFPFLKSRPGETLGIIAFSARQQKLIEAEINKESISENEPLPDWLFVKNIENVQGDERDHIWFSIAYAKNEKKQMVSQFGSLGQAGGENRLNVAITRARKSITLFVSFLPQELVLSESSGKGPKLLKEYLQFVYSFSIEKPENEMFKLNQIKMGDYKFQDEDVLIEIKDGKIGSPFISAKDFFGYKFMTLSQKGYIVSYSYSRFARTDK